MNKLKTCITWHQKTAICIHKTPTFQKICQLHEETKDQLDEVLRSQRIMGKWQKSKMINVLPGSTTEMKTEIDRRFWCNANDKCEEENTQ